MKAAIVGSFDPFHKGHLWLYQQLVSMFGDESYIIIANNPTKSRPFRPLSDEQKKHLIKLTIGGDGSNILVLTGWDLLVNFCDENDIHILLKGFRDADDFTYEYDMAMQNRLINPNVKTLLIPGAPEFKHISSTAIRDLEHFNDRKRNLKNYFSSMAAVKYYDGVKL